LFTVRNQNGFHIYNKMPGDILFMFSMPDTNFELADGPLIMSLLFIKILPAQNDCLHCNYNWHLSKALFIF